MDIDHAHRSLEAESKAIEQRRSILLEYGVPHIQLWFEDLFGPGLDTGAQFEKLGAILEFLSYDFDIDNAALSRILCTGRMNDAETYATIPNIREVERLLGCEASGSVFENNPV